jgi:hypothetical protein
MSQLQYQRPRFYEQQYLGARDIEAVVEYGRRARARHELGAHTWGISAGMTLLARENASGTQDVFLEPGTAWDGFGRPIVVLAPQPLPVAAFSHLRPDGSRDGPEGRQVKVWVRYREGPAGEVPPGFRVCDLDSQYTRVAEQIEFVASDEAAPSTAFLRASVQVGGISADARDILAAVRGAGAAPEPIEDTSIPYQGFPDPWGEPRWLVPLGVVWYLPAPAGTPGEFHGVDAQASEELRRYAGVVAGTISATGSHIRVRARDEPYDVHVWTDDLLWVQGPSRFEGDVRMLDAGILFRSESNTGAELDMRRLTDDDLLLRIGDAEAGNRRLVVASVEDPANPGDPPVVHEKLVVRDDGHVGINVADPEFPLTVKSVSGADEAVAGLVDSNDNLKWRLALKAGGDPGLGLATGAGAIDEPKVFVSDAGNVGIGTTTPTRRISVRGTGTAEELVSFEDAAGATKWHVNQLLGGDKSGLNFVETAVADARLFLAAGGNVGIGTPLPEERLHIAGGGVIWGNRSRLSADQGGSIELGASDGQVGIGTPYIDFHLVGRSEDFNVRLINEADGRLTAYADRLQATGDVEAAGWVAASEAYWLGPAGARVKVPVDVLVGRHYVGAVGNVTGTRSFDLTSRLPSVASASFIVALSDIGNVNVAVDARWSVRPAASPVLRLGANTFRFTYEYLVADSDGFLNYLSYVVIFVP